MGAIVRTNQIRVFAVEHDECLLIVVGRIETEGRIILLPILILLKFVQASKQAKNIWLTL